ncbi:DUF3566 domain-containing protein [Gordonia sp. X0973]|uniref:DUF3566 domain-containing protein n=1 Tax=Gordonia sp. X0973 TaxID=2742602 RepID=UPI0026574AA1|nr:DUF3566 domain-containing protein [Gordonia sp. X0973]
MTDEPKTTSDQPSEDQSADKQSGTAAAAKPTAGDAVSNTVDSAAGANAGTDKPGVKPPWQLADELAADTGKAAAGGASAGAEPASAKQSAAKTAAKAAGAKPPAAKSAGAKAAPSRIPAAKSTASKAPAKTTGKAKKPLITGTAAPKLDDAAAESAADSKRFVESPTRDIGRAAIKAKDLPDLDEIHVQSANALRSAPTQVGAATGGSRALRATVQVRRIDPWSTLKISAVLAVVGFFIWMIAVAVLYLVLEGMGVWSQVNSSVGTFTTDGGGSTDALGAGTVFGWAFLIGVVDAIILTALASVGAFIYNLCADFIGGIEVTLADLD